MSAHSDLIEKMDKAVGGEFYDLANVVSEIVWLFSDRSPFEFQARRLKTAVAMNFFAGYGDMGQMTDYRLAKEFEAMAEATKKANPGLFSLTKKAAEMIMRVSGGPGCKDIIGQKFESDFASKSALLELHKLLVEADIDPDLESEDIKSSLRDVDPESRKAIRRLLKQVGDDRLADYDAWRESGQVLVRLTESSGGPSDGYTLVLEAGEIIAIKYWYKDWGDGAEIEVTDGSAFDTLVEFFNAAIIIDEYESEMELELRSLYEAAQAVKDDLKMGKVSLRSEIALALALKAAGVILDAAITPPPPVVVKVVADVKAALLALRRVGNLRSREQAGNIFVEAGWALAIGDNGDHRLRWRSPWKGEGYIGHKLVKELEQEELSFRFGYVAKASVSYIEAESEVFWTYDAAQEAQDKVKEQAVARWKERNGEDERESESKTWIEQVSVVTGKAEHVIAAVDKPIPFDFTPTGQVVIDMEAMTKVALFADENKGFRPVLSAVRVSESELVATNGFTCCVMAHETKLTGTEGLLLPRQVIDHLRLLRVKGEVTVEVGKVKDVNKPGYRIDLGNFVFEGILPGTVDSFPNYTRIDPGLQLQPCVQAHFTVRQWQDNVSKLDGISDPETGMVAVAFNGRMTGYWYDRNGNHVAPLSDAYYRAIAGGDSEPVAIAKAISAQDGAKVVTCDAQEIQAESETVLFLNTDLLKMAPVNGDVTLYVYGPKSSIEIKSGNARAFVMHMQIG